MVFGDSFLGPTGSQEFLVPNYGKLESWQFSFVIPYTNVVRKGEIFILLLVFNVPRNTE